MNKKDYEFNLLIFIDGLPYSKVKSITFDIDDKFRRKKIIPVIPSIGFSANIHPIIFSGLYPDDSGFLNVFNLKLNSHRKGKYFSDLLGLFDHLRNISPFLSIVLHRLLTPFTGWTGHIPFKYLNLFERINYFSIYEKSPILNNPYTKVIPEFNKIGIINDDKVIEETLYFLRNASIPKNLVIFLFELDHISHKYGINSPEYNMYLEKINKWLKLLLDCYKNILKKFPKVIIFSDHGMAPVYKTFNIEKIIEEEFGLASPTTYIYFVDSLMLRIWIRKKSLADKIIKFLNDLNIGHLLNELERKKFKMTRREFGDLIFLLNEGIMFLPNFFGWRKMQALHGYWPELYSQWTCLLQWDNGCEDNLSTYGDKMSLFDLHLFLRKTIL